MAHVGGFADEAGFDEGFDLGADLVAGKAGGAGDGADVGGVPLEGDGIQHPLLLPGERVDNGFVIGRVVVDEALELEAEFAVHAFIEQTVEGADEAGIPAGEDVQDFDATGAVAEGVEHALVAAGGGDSGEAFAHFLQAEGVEVEGAEELEEGFIKAGDIAEPAGGGSDDHDAGIAHEEGAQAHEGLGIVHGDEDVVEVVDEQEGAFAAGIDEGEEDFAGLVLDIGAGLGE